MSIFTKTSTIKPTVFVLRRWLVAVSTVVLATLGCQQSAMARTSPNLVITTADVENMRAAITQEGKFKTTFIAVKSSVDQQIAQPITVPVPQDGGGGYTHERHKKKLQANV